MRVIFLDIDGVLVTNNSKTSWQADPVCIAALQKIIDNVHPQIIVSSSWKNMHGVNFSKVFSDWGLTDFNFAGKTPTIRGDDSIRGDEIRAWMDANTIPDHFVIVDDEDDMAELRPFLVQTNFKDGLTFDHAERIIRLLRK